jgi:hypothetical protein
MALLQGCIVMHSLQPYEQAVTFHEHVLPILEALSRMSYAG